MENTESNVLGNTEHYGYSIAITWDTFDRRTISSVVNLANPFNIVRFFLNNRAAFNNTSGIFNWAEMKNAGKSQNSFSLDASHKTKMHAADANNNWQLQSKRQD